MVKDAIELTITPWEIISRNSLFLLQFSNIMQKIYTHMYDFTFRTEVDQDLTKDGLQKGGNFCHLID